MTDVTLYQNNVGAVLPNVQIQQTDGTPFPLDSYTVTFYLWKAGSASSPKATCSCTVTDATNGVVSVPFAAGDLDTVGRYLGAFKVTGTGYKNSTKPWDVYVVESP